MGAADEDEAAHRIAAIRETIEETGLALGLSGTVTAGVAHAIRRGLASGQPLAGVLAALDLGLDLSALVPFARWCPNFKEARTFDTRF